MTKRLEAFPVMNSIRNGLMELKNGKDSLSRQTRQNIDMICVATIPIAHARSCANELHMQ